MAVDVTQAIQDLIQRILNDRETAVAYSEDPEGTLAAEGVTEGDASGVDWYQLVRETCGGTIPGLRDYGPSSGPAGGTSGGPTPPPPSSSGGSLDPAVQHLNYVTYESYKNDETIVQNIDNSTNVQDNSTNIDQSQNVNVDVDGSLSGGVNVDSNDTNVNATGDGAVAAGDDAVGATGDGAAASDEGPAVSGDGSAASEEGPATVGDDNLVNTGTNLGQQNTGDGAAQGIALGGDVTQNTGDGGVAAGDDINAPVNTGEFTGVQADGNSDIDDSALGFGEGDTTNVSDVEASEGAAVGAGDATGVKNDNDQIEYTDVDAEDSIVQTEQGEGDAAQEAVDLDAAAAPREVREIVDVEEAPAIHEMEEEEELQL